MPKVVIQPSYGNPAAKRHWKDTLDNEVPFTVGRLAEVLSGDQARLLGALHPSGRARFWGSTANHDKDIQQLVTGDVMLFTGENHVRAVGELGVIFQNAAFGDWLWSPHPKNGSYNNIYSLRGFEPVRIPYTEIWALPGFNEGDNFMGLRLLKHCKGDTILAGLRVSTLTAALQEDAAEQELIAKLARTGKIVPSEGFTKTETSYEQPARTMHVNRAESLLMRAYRASLPDDHGIALRVPTGLTDYYAESTDGSEIIEAKSNAGHVYVRQALSQLLDYRRFSPSPDKPVTRLAALFPGRPDDRGVRLLHDYGIDCIYLDDDGSFPRLEAAVPPPQI